MGKKVAQISSNLAIDNTGDRTVDLCCQKAEILAHQLHQPRPPIITIWLNSKQVLKTIFHI